MKNKYLLCGLIYTLLLFAACRKENSFNNDATTVTGNKDQSAYKPILVEDLPKLRNLRINGAICGFDTLKNIFYFSVASGTSIPSYTVNFDSTAAATVIINEQKVKSGGTITNTDRALTPNQTVTIRVINSLGTPAEYTLFITNLPIVRLTIGKTTIIGDDFVNAHLEIVDGDYKAHGGQFNTSTYIQLHLRGVTARNLPKKSYAVHVVNADESDKDLPLFGLRNDNSWIMDAMFIDQSRMRNRLCTDIWNSFNNVPYKVSEPGAINGTRGYMVEFFYNNFYRGLYCFTEKLDRKQLKIKKQYGNMYKADDVTDESTFLGITAPFNNQNKLWGGWELEYPDLGDTRAPDWSYLYNEINFLANAADGDFLADIKNRIDINNMVDYFILLNVTYATDNDAKNVFFSFYDNRTAPAFFYSPWDLDGTMGRNWGGIKMPNAITGAGNNNLLKRLLKLNAGNFVGLLKARWAQLKGNQLSKATIANRIAGYQKILSETKAFEREAYLSYNVDQTLEVETAYMNSWYSQQFNLFDAYVNGL